MARALRDFTTSRWFHVSNKAVHGQDLVRDDDDRDRFVQTVGEVVAAHRLQIEAYALMTNHYHLLVDVSTCDRPSDALRDAQSIYALRFNRRRDRSGALFCRRFWSKPVGGEAHYLQTARYIHRNPKDIVGLERLDAYRWSSLPAYLGLLDGESWLASDRLSGLIDPQRYLRRLQTPDRVDVEPLGGLPASSPVSREDVAEVVRSVSPEDGRLAADLRIWAMTELGVAGRVEVAALENVAVRSVGDRTASIRRRTDRDVRVATLCEQVLTELAEHAA